MMIKTKNLILLLCISLFIFSFIISEVKAQETYTPVELFTIPWGNEPNQLSIGWLGLEPPPDAEGVFYMYPGPAAINPTGGYVIIDWFVQKFSIDGLFMGDFDLETIEFFPQDIAVGNTGEVLMAMDELLVLFDSSMQLISTGTISNTNSGIAIYPSENNGFWCIYTIGTYNQCEDYFLEYHLDGSMSEPILLFSGSCDDPAALENQYVSPSGQTFPKLTDKYGFTYFWDYKSLERSSPTGEVVYTHEIYEDPAWAGGIADYFISWSGDYYTQHSTAEGFVLTKYDLHVDPVCILKVVTPLPHSGPSPVAIEFDASGTYDDDGDTLTYHWDFDGDLIFDEPVDDAYTGDPWNPTHEYTEDYEGPVCLKVTDNYQGECEIGVIISVDVE